jgi:large subunit ribosomal protein L5
MNTPQSLASSASRGPETEATTATALKEPLAMPGLQQRYLDRAVPALQKQFDYGNPMQVPQVAKLILNIGIGEAKDNPRALEAAVNDVRQVTGQQPVVVRARKSVAAFKLRAGMPVGIKVTLRGRRMWQFLEKLIGVALPRIRDFRGVPADDFDGRGNYSLGLREQIIFPEIDYDHIDKIRGMEVVIVTSARTDEEGRALLTELGMPFRRDER